MYFDQLFFPTYSIYICGKIHWYVYSINYNSSQLVWICVWYLIINTILCPTGYANELGESFRHMVPLRLVCFSYVISSGYVLSHAVFQGLHANKTDIVALQGTPTQNTSHQNHNTKVSPGIAFLDTLLWQGLASVLIPGMAINRLCAISRTVLNKRAGHLLGSASKKWIVTGIGLAAIPVIIHPIDR